MDKLVRKIEVPLAKNIVQKAGLYLVPKERLGELAEVAADAYQDYPLHNWFMGGKYDEIASKLLMDTNKWYYLAVQEATNSHDYGRKENGYEYWTVLKEVCDWSELER